MTEVKVVQKKAGISPPKKKIQRVFTNGHKCFTGPEAKFMKETMDKEADMKAVFNAKLLSYKKPRDPTCGELTSRENADYIIPISRTYETNYASSDTTANIFSTKTLPNETLTSSLTPSLFIDELDGSNFKYTDVHGQWRLKNVSMISSIRRKNDDIDCELKQIQALLQHKKAILASTR